MNANVIRKAVFLLIKYLPNYDDLVNRYSNLSSKMQRFKVLIKLLFDPNSNEKVSRWIKTTLFSAFNDGNRKIISSFVSRVGNAVP